LIPQQDVWEYKQTVSNSKICAKAVDKTMETFTNKNKGVQITDFAEFHGNRPILLKMVNFMENIMDRYIVN